MTYQTTRTGAQVDALLTKADSSLQAAHEAAADPHTNYLREVWTGPSTAFSSQQLDLPGLTDATEAQLRWVQSFANVPQADANNRVMKMGFFRTGGDPEGPLSAWFAFEPAFQVAANGHFWAEWHMPEVVGRDDVQVRLLSSWADFGPNTHSGGLIEAVIGSRYDKFWFINRATETTTAEITAATGGASFLLGWAQLDRVTDRRSLFFGPDGNRWEIAGVDSSDATVRAFGPFTWFSSLNLIDINTANNTLRSRRFDLATSGGNIAGFSRGDDSTHRFASTDIFGTVLGGIRNDGSLHVVPIAVASLPAATGALAGTRHFVNNATATTFASVVAGGGSNTVPVYCDGTNWRIG